MALAAGCATARESSYATVSMKDIAGPSAPAGTLQVGPGRVAGPNIDLREENNCVSGYWGKRLVNYCRDNGQAGQQSHWSGPDGDFTLSPNGDRLDVTGDLFLGGTSVPLNQTYALGAGRSGKGWDILRQYPALLVVTSNLVGLPH